MAVAATEDVAGPAGPTPHGRTHEQWEALLTVAALEARDNVVRRIGESRGWGHDSGEVLGSEIPTKGQQARHLAWAIPAYLLPPAALTYAPQVAGGQSLQPKVLSSESPFPKLFQILLHVTTLPSPAPTVHYSKATAL